MTPLRLVTSVLCVSILLASCSSTSISLSASQSSSVAPAPIIAEPHLQLGIAIDFYVAPGMQVPAVARQEIAYIKSLHANALSIAFPFFSNPAGTIVRASDSTPTTTQLGQLILAAEHKRLAVTLRPLLNEKSIGKSRVIWKPTNLASWFTEYTRFLLPYAALAQRDNVAVFVVGTEFSQFGKAAQWTRLDAAISTVYHGTLAYSNNWTTFPAHGNGGSGVIEMTDAYPSIRLPDDATPAALTSAWTEWARPLPKETILSEVGIASRPGEYLHPWESNPIEPPLIPKIQVNWFNAACRTIAADNLGGLYFWVVIFGQSLTTPATTNDPASFADMPGAAAIAQCFTTLGAIK
jgi:hypothetical protein